MAFVKPRNSGLFYFLNIMGYSPSESPMKSISKTFNVNCTKLKHHGTYE